MRKERSDGIANVMSVRNSEPASVRLGVRVSHRKRKGKNKYTLLVGGETLRFAQKFLRCILKNKYK